MQAPIGRKLGSDAHHHPPVEDDPQSGGRIHHHVTLGVGERDEVKGDGEVVLGEHFAQLHSLPNGGRVRIGLAVEMDQLDLGPAAHHSPGGHGGIDASRQEREHASRDPDRQAPGPRHAMPVHDGSVTEELDVRGRLWIAEIDAGSGSVLDPLADIDVDLAG